MTLPWDIGFSGVLTDRVVGENNARTVTLGLPGAWAVCFIDIYNDCEIEVSRSL